MKNKKHFLNDCIFCEADVSANLTIDLNKKDYPVCEIHAKLLEEGN